MIRYGVSDLPVQRLDQVRLRRHLEYALDNLGRAMLTLSRLERTNPGSPALRQLRSHLEAARDMVKEAYEDQGGL